ncbi:TonB-dependent receptor plug domain-containing protein [Sphingomonas sp. BN140010]|uniref:TonB-dependent receptor plug domain-containing protein n=1 Tax=Sphingomonas arvum TaxID=2992113 RepID=A0ABT3JC12_9SPHN|nr:TonB-dependent receptor plug domain-containing protein [Sphingomonas sp. BN140010]MCW3796610.1 TonB-dependent receptor plug domain-containing protein [Sphingomonas sp. BN140010]
MLRSLLAGLLATAALLGAPALAQPPVAPPKSVYTPADFARFAPKTAYDMLVQLPGFTIRSADNERGLGQASENVLINGQRIANKSGGALQELQRTAVANVQRIEVLDAATLGIAGLTGQVANVIVARAAKSSGQFEFNPSFRAHYTKPDLYAGSISYTGSTGPVEYTLSAKNDTGRGGFGGPVLIYDRAGSLIERRNERYHGESNLLTFETKLKLDGPGSSVGNLLLGYTPYWNPFDQRDQRIRVDGDNRARVTQGKLAGYYYDVNADYEFALGPGRLKLIGVRHHDHEPVTTTQVNSFDSGAPSQGVRFRRDSLIGETIARAEYGWKSGKNDWQLSLERAFNSLDQRGSLFELSPTGEFQERDFPEGSGEVQEVRYESILTFSRALTPRLSLQLAGGGEISRLERVDGDLPARKFFRPKGSLNLGWRPADGWDASFKLRRRVGQISFYDFLAQPKLTSDRQNAGNPDLVPPQSWETEVEVGRELGRWGKTRLKAYYYKISDIIDIIPIGDDGEGIGNLPSATRVGMESTSTINFDPLGWKGAKLDFNAGFDRSRVKDPLTGERRPISGNRFYFVDATLRHDVPGTPFAWGAGLSSDDYARNYYLTEVYHSWEGPWWLSAFVEHKNLYGLTVRAEVSNLLNARHRQDRTVYDGRRTVAPISFVQKNNQLIGPIFSLSIKGTF